MAYDHDDFERIPDPAEKRPFEETLGATGTAPMRQVSLATTIAAT
jgi:hypothetical protein